jgi:hypothetical protein
LLSIDLQAKPKISNMDASKESSQMGTIVEASELELKFSNDLADAGVFGPALKSNMHCDGTFLFMDGRSEEKFGRI